MTADGTEGATAAVPAAVTGDASDGAGMTDPAAVTTAEPAPAEVTEFAATTLPGWPMAWVCLGVMAVGIALTAVGGAAAVPAGVVLITIAGFARGGLTAIAPGEARVVQLLGRYTGTIRAQGLQWVSPVTKRRKISTRIRNHETGQAKVNDADGHPIEIAAVVVWQVA